MLASYWAAMVVGVLYASLRTPWFERVECLRSEPWGDLKELTILGDAGIFAAYMAMPVVLVSAWRRMKERPDARLLALYGLFILLCGFTHLVSILTIFWPLYWLAAKLKLVTAAVSIAVAVTTFRSRHAIVGLGESGAALAREAEAARRAEEKAERESREAMSSRAREAATNEVLRETNRELEAARAREAERARAEANRASEAENKNANLEDMVRRLQAQDAALATLESPILEALDGVLVSVLVGTLSSQRANEWNERLTAAVYDRKAHAVVIDVTGLTFVDTAVAGAILKTIRCVRIVGSRCIVTGIRPEVGQTLVGLGVDLGDLPTLGTLRAGLELAGRMVSKKA